jgi:hypothetical protein
MMMSLAVFSLKFWKTFANRQRKDELSPYSAVLQWGLLAMTRYCENKNLFVLNYKKYFLNLLQDKT